MFKPTIALFRRMVRNVRLWHRHRKEVIRRRSQRRLSIAYPKVGHINWGGKVQRNKKLTHGIPLARVLTPEMERRLEKINTRASKAQIKRLAAIDSARGLRL